MSKKSTQVATISTSRHKEVRYLDIHEDEQFDEGQFVAWLEQASQLPGERMCMAAAIWVRGKPG